MKYNALLFIAGTLSLTANLAQAESIEDALNKCKSVDNSLQRLVCYDRVVKDMGQYSGLEEAIKRGYPVPPANSRPQAGNNPRPALPEVAQQNAAPEQSGTRFGLEHTEANDSGGDMMYASIVKIDRSLRDKYVVTLDNGTVWRQTDSDTLKLEEGQSISIERGLLGAFYLSRSDVNRQMKVKRIK
ncbi:hypothetical protein [Alteromonas sp. H39]|uniref:hypothetical protein n=1 Tax=Alteromonas sp. H39 TaxID=3389876 RepID=UPI0039E0C1AF